MYTDDSTDTDTDTGTMDMDIDTMDVEDDSTENIQDDMIIPGEKNDHCSAIKILRLEHFYISFFSLINEAMVQDGKNKKLSKKNFETKFGKLQVKQVIQLSMINKELYKYIHEETSWIWKTILYGSRGWVEKEETEIMKIEQNKRKQWKREVEEKYYILPSAQICQSNLSKMKDPNFLNELKLTTKIDKYSNEILPIVADNSTKKYRKANDNDPLGSIMMVPRKLWKEWVFSNNICNKYSKRHFHFKFDNSNCTYITVLNMH